MQKMINRYAPLIKMISENIEKKANSALQKYGITNVQMQVLMVLYSSGEESCSLKELEKVFRVAQSTIAGIVSRLESKGFVEGFPNLRDKRTKMIRLTQKGKEICPKVEHSLAATDIWLTSELTDAEKRDFLRILQKVCAVI